MNARLVSCLVIASFLASLLGCGLFGGGDQRPDPVLAAKAEAFLDEFTPRWVELSRAVNDAQWRLNTRIVEGDDSAAREVEAASGELAAFVGATETVAEVQSLLEDAHRLEPLQVLQLRAILYAAADQPQSVADVVAERVAAEALQTQVLFGHPILLDGREVTANDIDRILRESSDESERLRAWTASKEVGRELRDGLARLADLRNRTVQAMGYENFFEYQVADYAMTVPQLMSLMRQLLEELRPLYRELHTWARYELAARYRSEVPDLLPAHWLPNRWGQNWAALVEVEGLDVDAAIAAKAPPLEYEDEARRSPTFASQIARSAWVIREAERFYGSLGFGVLPATFWERSSLYPLPPGAGYRKNSHASAWHMDLDRDVRSLMSVVPDAEWFETTHHELGHIYYYLAYSRPGCPPLLRKGANRAFHEAIGSLLGMVSMHRAFLEGRGLIEPGTKSDSVRALLREAMDFVVFNPFSAGTMTHFEHDLYATALRPEDYNRRWWSYVQRFQGIAPPSPRSEEYCDAATKTHINDDAAQYYDYVLSQVILHQLHAHIAREILGQDPRNTDYWGRRDVGQFLADILAAGGTRPGREVLEDVLGEGISARAMLEYFEPLLEFLRHENEGRVATLPAL